MKAYLPPFFLRWFATVKIARELRRRALERESENDIIFDESRLPTGCRLRNSCNSAGRDLRCPLAEK